MLRHLAADRYHRATAGTALIHKALLNFGPIHNLSWYRYGLGRRVNNINLSGHRRSDLKIQTRAVLMSRLDRRLKGRDLRLVPRLIHLHEVLLRVAFLLR